MARFFNSAGPCRPDQHYMLPPERRLPGVGELIERGQYFVVHAPRQSGKTTAFRTLAQRLTAEGRFAALLTTCEEGQRLKEDLEGSVDAILAALATRASNDLPAELWPPPVDASQPAGHRLTDLLTRWAKASPRPLVLFFDEIDALSDDALVSVLRQLRSAYDTRPPAGSIFACAGRRRPASSAKRSSSRPGATARPIPSRKASSSWRSTSKN